MPTLQRIEDFFFLAMLRGWASGNNGTPCVGRPGWHSISYEDANFPGYKLVDSWGIDPETKLSLGITMITYFGVPRWVMCYGTGTYPKRALPTLRAALMENYHRGVFNGGRGPVHFSYGDFVYQNTFKGNFSNFEGVERVAEKAILSIGHHYYWGRSLTPPERPEVY